MRHTRILAPFLALFMVAGLITPAAQTSVQTAPRVFDHVPRGRLALLSRGINLNTWFTSWSNPASYATRFRPAEAAFLKRAGFTVCRLPLAPDLLFDLMHPAQPKDTIRSVDKAVRLLLDAGLAVVFDPIHGPSSSAEWESKLDHDPSFRAAVELSWEALARHFAAMSTDRVFFEVMNEPHLSARERVDPSWWQPVQRGPRGSHSARGSFQHHHRNGRALGRHRWPSRFEAPG